MTHPPLVWLDCETTALPLRRRAWDVAAIVRQPDGTDVEYQWFVHLADLDLPTADPTALEAGRFWQRHPQADHARVFGAPILAPDRPGVYRLAVVLDQLAPLVDGKARILGSAPWFDMMTVGPRMADRGIEPGWHYHPDDVPAMIKGFLAGWVGLTDELAHARSDDLCRAIGVDPDEYPRHTAIGDCRLFRDAYDVILRGGRALQDGLAASAAAQRFAGGYGCKCPTGACAHRSAGEAAFRQETLGTWTSQ